MNTAFKTTDKEFTVFKPLGILSPISYVMGDPKSELYARKVYKITGSLTIILALAHYFIWNDQVNWIGRLTLLLLPFGYIFSTHIALIAGNYHFEYYSSQRHGSFKRQQTR
ncbi:hypothetical protein [uncultured Algimonas sp.]|uniref:hypothetical protein n=1 Tax=uncultured Algimonas sp. TaxID=1547920 RepID=UPI00261A6512|nr:hypothetical protein [uncultured Algimonas sp.]